MAARPAPFHRKQGSELNLLASALSPRPAVVAQPAAVQPAVTLPSTPEVELAKAEPQPAAQDDANRPPAVERTVSSEQTAANSNAAPSVTSPTARQKLRRDMTGASTRSLVAGGAAVADHNKSKDSTTSAANAGGAAAGMSGSAVGSEAATASASSSAAQLGAVGRRDSNSSELSSAVAELS